jgi:hypothetical protein
MMGAPQGLAEALVNGGMTPAGAAAAPGRRLPPGAQPMPGVASPPAIQRTTTLAGIPAGAVPMAGMPPVGAVPMAGMPPVARTSPGGPGAPPAVRPRPDQQPQQQQQQHNSPSAMPAPLVRQRSMSNAAPIDARTRQQASAMPVPSGLRAGSGVPSSGGIAAGSGGAPPAVAPRAGGSDSSATAAIKNAPPPPRFDMAWLQYAPAESEMNPATVPPPTGRPQRPDASTQSRAAATAAVAAARRATLAPSKQTTAGVAVLAKISAIGFMANQEVLPGTTVGAFRERVLSALPDLPQLKGAYTVHVGDENVPASDDSSQLAELVNANDTVYLKKVEGGADKLMPMDRSKSTRMNPADMRSAMGTTRTSVPAAAAAAAAPKPAPAALAPPKKKADDVWAALDAEQAAMRDDLQLEPLDDEPPSRGSAGAGSGGAGGGGGADDFDLSDLDFDVDKLLEDAGVNDVLSDLDALTAGDSGFDWNAPDDKPDDQALPEDALATVPLPPVPTMSEFAAPPPMMSLPPPPGGMSLPPPVAAAKAPPAARNNSAAPSPALASPPAPMRATGPARNSPGGGAAPRGAPATLAVPPAATPPPVGARSNSNTNLNSAPPPVALRNVPPPAQFTPPASASPPVPRRAVQQAPPPVQTHVQHQPPQFRLPPAAAVPPPVAAVLPPVHEEAPPTPPPPELPPPAVFVIDFDADGRPTSLPPETFEWCRAAYKYDANSYSELGFEAGDWIALTEKDDDGWWRGFSIAALEAGEPSKYFPSSFIDVSSCFAPY